MKIGYFNIQEKENQDHWLDRLAFACKEQLGFNPQTVSAKMSYKTSYLFEEHFSSPDQKDLPIKQKVHLFEEKAFFKEDGKNPPMLEINEVTGIVKVVAFEPGKKKALYNWTEKVTQQYQDPYLDPKWAQLKKKLAAFKVRESVFVKRNLELSEREFRVKSDEIACLRNQSELDTSEITTFEQEWLAVNEAIKEARSVYLKRENKAPCVRTEYRQAWVNEEEICQALLCEFLNKKEALAVATEKGPDSFDNEETAELTPSPEAKDEEPLEQGKVEVNQEVKEENVYPDFIRKLHSRKALKVTRRHEKKAPVRVKLNGTRQRVLAN